MLPNATRRLRTFGTLNAARATRARSRPGTASDHHGYDFLIGAGAALDPARYFIVATEMFANGFSSSPSNTPAPFDGPRFPPSPFATTWRPRAGCSQSELGVTHLRADRRLLDGRTAGVPVGGVASRTSWTAIVPYCGTAKTYPHGVVRLEGAIGALTADAAFNEGNYTVAADERAGGVVAALGRLGVVAGVVAA